MFNYISFQTYALKCSHERCRDLANLAPLFHFFKSQEKTSRLKAVLEMASEENYKR